MIIAQLRENKLSRTKNNNTWVITLQKHFFLHLQLYRKYQNICLATVAHSAS